MSMATVFAEAESVHRAIVYRDTWGHLDTKPNTTHAGHIVFALGCYGDTVVLDWVFDGVTANPWIYEELHEHIGKYAEKTKREWGVWRFDGTYHILKNGKYRFTGKTRPMRLSFRFAKSATHA